MHAGYRLVFDPMEAVVVHYVLAGVGSVRLTNGSEAALRPDRIMIVPPRLGQALEAPGAAGTPPTRDMPADERCAALEAGGMVRFMVGETGWPA